ncbi:uncharacterized protein LOC128753622 isoform X2 [Synchiropus splendidus]|nr:uncharacterized protein LOC128753622 isoform X2 [Synchiropus splendidus]
MQMFRLEGHEIQLVGQLQRQQRNLQFCDTLLQTDGISIPTHSCVLAALSPYLSERLSATAPPPFGHKRHLQIQSITAATLLKLVGLLYSGKMEVIGSDESNDVLAAARQFGIKSLKEDHLNNGNEKKYMHCEKYSVKTPPGSKWPRSWTKRDAQVQVGKACDHCGAYSLVKKRSFGTQTESLEQDNPLTPQTLDPVLSPEQNLSTTAQNNNNKTHDLDLGKQPNNSDSTLTPEPLNLSLNPPRHSVSPRKVVIQKDTVDHAQGEEAPEQTIDPLQTTSEVKMGSSTVRVCPTKKVARKNLTRMRQMETERFSFKVKLRRKSSGGVWEVVGFQDLDEKLSSLAPQGSLDPRSQQLTDVCYSPSSDKSEPSAAAQPQDCAVESEEQIEKLLEDIMMGLDILPDLESDHKKSGCLQQNQQDFLTSDSVREQDPVQINQDPLTETGASEGRAPSQPIKHGETLQQENVSDGQRESPNPDIASDLGDTLYAPGLQDILGSSQDVDCFPLLPLPKMQHPCCLSPIDPLSPEADRPPQDPAQPWLQPWPTPEDHNCIAGDSDVGKTGQELLVSLHNSDPHTSQSQTQAEATFRSVRRKRSGSKDDQAVKQRKILKRNTVSEEVGPRMEVSEGKTALKCGGEPSQTTAIHEWDSGENEADQSKVRTSGPVVEDGSVQQSTVSLQKQRTGKVRLNQRHHAAAAPSTAAVCLEEMSERRNKEVGGSRTVETDDCNILVLGERKARKRIVTRKDYQKFVNGSNMADVKSGYLTNIGADESQKHDPEDEGKISGVTADWKDVSQDENHNEILQVMTDDHHDRKSLSPTACWLDSLLVNVTEESAGSPQKLPAQDVPFEKLHMTPKYGNPANGGLSDFEEKLPHPPTEGSTSTPDAHVLTLNPACSTDEEILDRTSEHTDLFPQTEEDESEVDVVLQSPGQEACVMECVDMLHISTTDEEEEVEVNVTDDSQ